MTDWRDDAACKDAPSEWFFPVKELKQGRPGRDDKRGTEVGYASARLLCAECPVREDCLLDALDRFEKHGMWGGLSPRERRPLQAAHVVLYACVQCGKQFRAKNRHRVTCSDLCRDIRFGVYKDKPRSDGAHDGHIAETGLGSTYARVKLGHELDVLDKWGVG